MWVSQLQKDLHNSALAKITLRQKQLEENGHHKFYLGQEKNYQYSSNITCHTEIYELEILTNYGSRPQRVNIATMKSPPLGTTLGKLHPPSIFTTCFTKIHIHSHPLSCFPALSTDILCESAVLHKLNICPRYRGMLQFAIHYHNKPSTWSV